MYLKLRLRKVVHASARNLFNDKFRSLLIQLINSLLNYRQNADIFRLSPLKILNIRFKLL